MNRPGVITLALAMIGGCFLTRADLAAAQEQECRQDFCVGDEITYPEAPGRSDSPAVDDEDPTPVSNGPQCTWVRDPGPQPGGDGLGSIPDIGPRQNPDDYLVYERCDGELTGRIRWASPANPGTDADAPPPAPTPGQLAETIRVRLEGSLPDPIVTTSPPAGEAAVVDHPTFLAVDNWTGTVTDQECFLLLCVTVNAIPQLEWFPGEPDTPAITCAGDGTRFDPTRSPQSQAAAPGACAYAYRHRTGISGRPARWTGTVSITWTLTWSSTTGIADTLPSVTRSTDVPRPVQEVQAVVTLTR